MQSGRSKRLSLLVLSLIFILSANPGHALARSSQALARETVPLLQPLSAEDNEVIGVVAAGLFAYPVLQQAEGQGISVTNARNKVTQFGMAADLGNIGLLAHNYLAGRSFFDLSLGQRIYLVRGTGRVEVFVVTRILKYQALTPNSPYSDFREVGDTSVIEAGELFKIAYSGEYHITFQTCIEMDGESSWGRLFVIAEPVQP